MLRSTLTGLLVIALLALPACGEVEYIEECKDAESAETCMDCCVDAGFIDWSYNSSYTPACGCIE